MRILYLLFALAAFTLSAASKKEATRLHVCTVCNKGHPNLDKLITSCEKKGITLEILGMGLPYDGNGMKLIRVRDFLNKLPEKDVLLFVDAFDVLILADKETILNKFIAMKAPIVMGAEKNCHPPEYREKYPPKTSSWRFINTGTYIGYVSDLKKWLDSLRPIQTNKSDQVQVTAHYFSKAENERPFILDSKCELFLPLYKIGIEKLEFQTEKGLIKCIPHGTFPCVLHANGHKFVIFNKVFDEMVMAN